MSRPAITLTPLEAEVMRGFWAASDDGSRIRPVADAINADRAEPLGYTTIQKVVTILRDKGALELVDGSGHAHVYRPRISRAEAARDHVADLGSRLFGRVVGPVLTQFAQHAEMTDAELRALRDWIDQKLVDGGADDDG